jgi:TonB family protein
MLSVDAYVVQMAMLAPNNVPPLYPERLRQQWVEGAVLLEFIVGTDGRADMRTVRVIETSSPAFTQAVRAHLPFMTYYPASIGGCLVRMEVKQPFTFGIRP